MKIAFIGGGNMARALIGGLYAASDKGDTIRVADPGEGIREQLEQQWPVSFCENAVDAISDMDAIVLAVKPQDLPAALREIRSAVCDSQLIISIVAGIHVSQIAAGLEASPPIIRTMPNLPALIDLGITGMYAQPACSLVQRELAESLMRAASEIVWLQKESLLDVVTAVSGSGPAYFFYLVEALQNAGARLGLPAEVAAKLALHTAHGAGAMAVKSKLDVVELRRRVTSRGGTTEAAIEQLEAGDFIGLVDAAVTAASKRAQELANKGSIE